MHRHIARLSLVALVLAAGCGGGGVEGDLEKSGETLRKDAEKMSVADLEAKLKELEKHAEALQKEVGNREPTQAEMQKMTKIVEVTGIYTAALMQKRTK